MRDLFSQCMRVRVCHAQECQFALTCTSDGRQGRTALLDNGGWAVIALAKLELTVS